MRKICQNYERNYIYTIVNVDHLCAHYGDGLDSTKLDFYDDEVNQIININPFKLEYVLDSYLDNSKLMNFIYCHRNKSLHKFVIKQYITLLINYSEEINRFSRKWQIYLSRILRNKKIPCHNRYTHHAHILTFLHNYLCVDVLREYEKSDLHRFYESPIFDINLIRLLFKFVF